jgi:hypothetical protein
MVSYLDNMAHFFLKKKKENHFKSSLEIVWFQVHHLLEKI